MAHTELRWNGITVKKNFIVYTDKQTTHQICYLFHLFYHIFYSFFTFSGAGGGVIFFIFGCKLRESFWGKFFYQLRWDHFYLPVTVGLFVLMHLNNNNNQKGSVINLCFRLVNRPGVGRKNSKNYDQNNLK